MRKSTVVCLLLVLPSLPAWAAKSDWQVLQQNGDERVALDIGRIGRLADGNVAAWSRLSLGFDIPDVESGVRYSTIEAFNSYDCKRHEYSTLKRVYLDGKDKVVREETVAQPRSMLIGEDSFEEKLLPEVCQRRANAPLVATPKPVVQAQAATTATPKVKQVADSQQVDLPGKPRLIDLPKIDPSKVDNPEPDETPKSATTKSTSPKPVASGKVKNNKAAGDKTASDKAMTDKSAADKTPQAKKEPERKSTAAKPPLDAAMLNALIEKSNKAAQAAKAAKSSAKDKPANAPDYYAGDVSRAEIERQLATFGPRRNKSQSTKNSDKQDMVTAKAITAYVPWSYSGKGSPDNWAKLSPDNHLCGDGQRQSPIDIHDGIPVDLEPIQFNYGKASYSEIDTGHTIQINIAEGQSLRIMGKTWQLIALHFHKPAEERVNGQTYPMVVHLVHKDAAGNIAVVAVLLEPGTENPVVQAIWNNLPLEQGMVISPAEPLDLSQLLPEKRDYWTYMGSLTTPPCTEDVLWMVLKQSVKVSPEQINIFGRLYPNNARPIQAANNRLIKESR